MKKNFFLIIFFFIAHTVLISQTQYRNKISIPDILGYKTLKCDFHMHTVFSDGDVWPTFRVKEAWREGLDAIALTDHIEYQPKKDYIPTNHNSPYAIAKGTAEDLGITLIKGAEITRSMPPGHLNAIFIQDGNALIKDEWKESVLEAKKQGGIINWNHPGWISQQPDGIPKWYEEHSFLLENKMLIGIEVVNSMEYYPLVLDWCLEKQITILGNSDVHEPASFEYDYDDDGKRAMTLVFATANTSDAIKEALFNQRTVAYFDNKLFGEQKYLEAIFNKSISFKSNHVKAIGRGTVNLQVTNNSDVTYYLELVNEDENIIFPKKVELMAGRTVLFSVRARKDDITLKKNILVNYSVTNLFVSSEKKLIVPFNFEINIEAKKK